MEILKITKGRLLTDNYEFVPVFDEKDKIEFEIAGTKYYDSKEIKEKIKLEENLYLILEPNNIEDENAIKIICKVDNQEKLLGYVPRYYAKSLTELLNKNIKYSAKIRKLRLESLLDDENISVTVKLIFDIN